ncbi:MAG: hypothetical protein HZB46_17160 [Solirubrobacterales bacterium]|nr:hypothetical protein [Solirubrobacterales bacterium]
MPYVVITSERPEGAALCERVTSTDFETDHFKACLADRLAWAVEDAEHQATGAMPVAEDVPAHA